MSSCALVGPEIIDEHPLFDRELAPAACALTAAIATLLCLCGAIFSVVP
jgi:hypothetical protein